LSIQWKNAVSIGMIIWMIGVIISSLTFNLTKILPLNIVDLIYIILLIPIVWACSRLYFGHKIASVSEGTTIGLVFIAISLILDILITVPIWVKSYVGYISSWQIWAYFIEILLITIFTAAMGHNVRSIEKFK